MELPCSRRANEVASSELWRRASTRMPWPAELTTSEKGDRKEEVNLDQRRACTGSTSTETMATAHLIHGYIGVGKTTFARRLERDLRAIRFSHDEWMTALYGRDPPANLFREYADRITSVIWTLWPRCLTLGQDVTSRSELLESRATRRGAADCSRKRRHLSPVSGTLCRRDSLGSRIRP